MKEKIATTGAPQAIGPYSQAIKTDTFVFLSGQIPLDPVTGVMPEGIEAQTRRVFSNIRAVLSEAGLTLNNVVKTTVFLDNMNDFQVMNGIYAEYFSEPYPARSTVEVAKLPKGALIEIECIAQRA
jgi:2-iminobutanoate/2-iminopropanoate deaminase